jgi:phage/plasmid primase-like uncharacterized protein
MLHPIDAFRDAILAAGFQAPTDITPGKWHRYSTNGKRSDTAGYAFMFADERGGIFGDFRTGEEHVWQVERGDDWTPEQRREQAERIAKAKKEREEQQQLQHAKAREEVAAIWADATPAADDHPYLVAKGVKVYGLMQHGDALLVPMKDNTGTLHSLQYIYPNGRKLFHPGGRIKGCYAGIGKPNGSITIAEGYATAATLYQSTGQAVAIAFNANNLTPVSVALQQRFPGMQFTIAADNDRMQKCQDCGDEFDVDLNPEVCPECGSVHRKRNTGLEEAAKAADAIGASVIVPPPGDFNDLAQSQGMEAVATIAANDNLDPIDIFAEFPVPPIRREMLPDTIADYAFDQGELVGVEPAMIAIPALVACASVLHDGVELQVKRNEKGWRESARLWCAVVGNPSIKKSPSIAKAISRVRKINADLAEDNKKTLAKHAAEVEAYKEAKKEAKKTGEAVTAPEQPMLQRMMVQDTTVEALSEVLKDNARGILCLQDELSGWFGSMDAYSGGKAGGKDRAHWLEAYNGGGKTVDRVMRGSINIPNWSVSMIGGIQPDAIRRIAQNMTDDGLMQRFMIVVGRNAKEYDRQEDTAAHDRFRALVDHLHSILPGQHPITMSEDAHVVREALNEYTAELMEYGMLPGGLVSHLGKWSGLFARLTLLFHAIECHRRSVHPATLQVTGDTAKRVDLLMRKFLLPHALAYYTDILGAASELEHARWIAGHILSKKLDVLQNRDLMVHYKQWRGLDDWKRQKVMQVLQDMGWLVPLEDARETRRGAHTWAVVSTVHAKFSAKAQDETQKRAKIREEMLALKNA